MSAPAPTPAETPKKPRRICRTLRVGVPLLVVLTLMGLPVVAKTGLRDKLINCVLRNPNVTVTTQARRSSGSRPRPCRERNWPPNSAAYGSRSTRSRWSDRAWWRLVPSLPELGTVTLDRPHISVELPLEQFEPEPKHPLPTLTGVVKNGALTVRVPGLDEPAIDIKGVDLTFRVVGENGGRVLVVDPVTLFQNQKFSPKLCDKMVHLIAPALGEALEVSGEVSLALNEFRVPIGTPRGQIARNVEMEGTLALHNVTTQTSGPLMQAVVKVIADMYRKRSSRTSSGP